MPPRSHMVLRLYLCRRLSGPCKLRRRYPLLLILEHNYIGHISAGHHVFASEDDHF